MSLVLFRGFIPVGLYTSEYLPARCWGLEGICFVGKRDDFTDKDSAVVWCVVGAFSFKACNLSSALYPSTEILNPAFAKVTLRF